MGAMKKRELIKLGFGDRGLIQLALEAARRADEAGIKPFEKKEESCS